MTLKEKRLDYKWAILAACFLMTFTSLGFCSSNKGLYLAAIADVLKIPRSLLSIRDSARYVASALMNLCFGVMISKYGVRKLVAFGFAMLSGCMFLNAVAENVFQFSIGGLMLGLGLTFTTGTMSSAIIRRWFKKDIGKITGVVYCANGIGGALAAQIVSPMIYEEGNPFGYRNAYLLVAAVMLISGIVIVALLREQPKGAEKVTYQKVSKKRGEIWVGIPYEQAVRRPAFYLAALSVLLTGLMLQGIGSSYAAHLKDVGINPGHIATIASASSIMLTCSKLFSGVMYDKWGLKPVMLICQVSAVLAFAVLLLIDASKVGITLAVAYTVFKTIAMPLETLMIPLLVFDLFGVASSDKILGIFLALNYTGYAIGEPLINLCYDVLGSYKVAFAICAILMALVTVLFQFALRSGSRDKKEIMQAQANAANG